MDIAEDGYLQEWIKRLGKYYKGEEISDRERISKGRQTILEGMKKARERESVHKPAMSDYERKLRYLGYALQNLKEGSEKRNIRAVINSIVGFKNVGEYDRVIINEIKKIREKYPMSDKEKSIIDNFLEESQSQKPGLESYIYSISSIAFLLGSLFFFSSNITGNTVGSLAYGTSNYIGIVLFILGLIGFYVWKKH